MAKLSLPSPTPWQHTWLDSPARRKVLRAGRRGGKSRGDLIAATAGHGPGPYGAKPFKGALGGVDIVWFAQDYPNLKITVWNEEVERRFKGQPFAEVNENEMRLTFPDVDASVYFRSAEAIAGVRGIGKRLGGVIIDEAAHLDLQNALLDIVLPACLDNNAWLILGSTTNAGLDGNKDKRTPSYFNLICEQIDKGERSSEWAAFYGTAYDNPYLNPSAIDALIAEYPAGSAALEQEVFARLLKGGGGAAFPMLDRKKHIIPSFSIPIHWNRWFAFDPGFWHPFAIGEFAIDELGNVYLVDSMHGRQLRPDELAPKLTARWPDMRQCPVAGGHDLWDAHKTIRDDTPKMVEVYQAHGIIAMRKANRDRKQGYMNMLAYCAIHDDRPPRFRMFDTPNNRKVFDCLERMVRDPDDLEDVLKVDAIEGQGGDDPYDMTRYGLAERMILSEKPVERELHDIYAPDVLLAEYERNYRASRVRPQPAAVDRHPAETDPMFGDF